MSERLRVTGHKLLVESAEGESTGTCTCGRWQESGSTRAVVRDEYRHHLRQERVAQVSLYHRLCHN